jgi:hypothetical protein
MPAKIEFLLRQNLFAVFGERDAATRRATIASIWKADGIFIDPDGPHAGHAEIDEAVERLLRKFPDFVFSERGVVDAYHGIGRLAWGFGPPDAAPAITGLDVIVSANDQISALYTFLDPVTS